LRYTNSFIIIIIIRGATYTRVQLSVQDFTVLLCNDRLFLEHCTAVCRICNHKCACVLLFDRYCEW